MINPHHECGNTSAKHTELWFKDSSCGSVGTSLHVILHAFQEVPVTWYSTSFGYDDVILGVDPARSAELGKPHHSTPGPVQKSSAGRFDYEEYRLTGEVMAKLGMRFAKGQLVIARGGLVRWQLQVHDDCFASIQPVEEALLRKLIACVLELHSFYLGEAVNWGNIPETITDTLQRLNHIYLVSSPISKQTDLFWREDRQSGRWFFKRHSTKEHALNRIEVRNGAAILHNLNQQA